MLKRFTQEHAAQFRALMLRRIEETDPGRTAELALSGGVDSTTVLFAMLESGRRPRCITFHVEGHTSADLLASRALAKRFGLELAEVTLPRDVERIAADVRALLPHCHVVKKTVVQCLHPWLYIVPAMQSDLILNGLGADDLYCNQRKVQVALRQPDGEQAILQYRHVYSLDLNFSGGNIERYVRRMGKRTVDVYNDKAVEDFFLQFEAKALHKPFEKALSVQAFRDYYDMGRFFRPRSAYQINSGLRERHEQLLRSPYNRKGAKEVVVVYRDMAAQMRLNRQE